MFLSPLTISVLTFVFNFALCLASRSDDNASAKAPQISTDTLKYGIIHGSIDGGFPFNDYIDLKMSQATYCNGVEVFWHPDQLFSVRFLYDGMDASSPKIYHGHTIEDGFIVSNERFMFKKGEKINKVITYIGTRNKWQHNSKKVYFIVGIQFFTTDGRSSKLYGSDRGEKSVESYEGFTFSFATGRADSLLDQLRIVWVKEDSKKYGIIHGSADGGLPFNDFVDLELSDTAYCIGVEVFWHRDQLFSVRFLYNGMDSSNSKVYRGRTKSDEFKILNARFMLKEGEKISKVITYSGTRDRWSYKNKMIYFIVGIQFFTTNGRSSKLYGSSKGDKSIESYEGYTFGFAKGRADTLLDQLQIVWNKEDPKKYGIIHGSIDGGLPFNDFVDLKLSDTAYCNGVEVFWHPDQLFSIRFLYDGMDSSSPKIYHGHTIEEGFTISNERFMLKEGEKINKIVIYTGTRDRWWYNKKKGYFIVGIQFFTTNERSSKLYGSSKGDKSIESYEGFTFGFAKGRAGTLLDQLQIVWNKEDNVNDNHDN